MKIVCWYSGGVTSAVAVKMILEKYPKASIEIIFFETGNHHPDNQRFFHECEQWFNHPIITTQDENHDDIYSVFRKEKFINSPFGAPCTKILKKRMRQKWERYNEFDIQVMGFEYSKKEIKRADRFLKSYPHTNAIFPLIDSRITKDDAITILEEAQIEIPKMYRLGYSNNNCIGCVKGGMGYWNKIRQDFPSAFEEMAKMEREIGGTCLRDNGQPLFLDELDPERGRMSEPLVGECGIFCDE